MPEEYDYLLPEGMRPPVGSSPVAPAPAPAADDYEYLPPEPAVPAAPSPAPARAPAVAADDYEYLPPDQSFDASGAVDQSLKQQLETPKGVASPFVQPDAEREAEVARLDKLTAPYRSSVAQLAMAAKNNPALTDEQINAFLDSLDARLPEASAVIPDRRAWALDIVRGTRSGEYTPGVAGMKLPEALSDRALAPDPGLVTAAKEALFSLPGGAAGIAAAAAANRVPIGGLPKFGLVLGAGLGGGLLGQSAAEQFYSDQLQAQRAVNEAANPISAFLGGMAPGFLTGRPTLRGSLGLHAAGAGVGAGVEAASELVQGEFDPVKIGLAAAGNALMAQPTRLGQRLGFEPIPARDVSYRGIDRSAHITYDAPVVRTRIINELSGSSVDDVILNNPIADTPENRQRLETAKQAIEAGDTVAAVREMSALPVKTNNGLDVSTATQYINEATAGWANAPAVTVHASPSDPSVPAHLGAEEGTLGVFDKDTGEVHVFADQLVDAVDAKAVAFHEILGHAGLAWKYQDDLDNLLISLYDRGSPAFKKAVDDWNAANPDAYDNISDPHRQKAARIEEVLAETSERGDLPQDYLDRIGVFIRGAARKAGMKNLGYSDAEIRAILKTGHDNIIAGGDRATGLGGVRYIYAGPSAETADLNAYNEARKLPGVTKAQSEARRRMTGWFKGADNHWRFEINDQGFDFKPGAFDQLVEMGKVSGLEAGPSSMKAGDVFDHPELFAAYPQLADIDVVVQPFLWDFGNTMQGSYYKNRLQISPYAKNPRETAIHELQHAVQDIEGFSPGGTPERAMMSVDDDVALSALPQMYEYVSKLAAPIKAKAEVLMAAVNDPELMAWGDQIRTTNSLWDRYQYALKAEGVENDFVKSFKDEWLAAYRQLGETRKQIEAKYLSAEDPIERQVELTQLGDYLASDIGERERQIASVVNDYNHLIEIQNNLAEAHDFSDADLARRALSEVPGANYQAYKSLHGEVEARDTALRLDMTPEQRAVTEPMTLEGEVRPNEYVFGTPEVAGEAASASEGVRAARRKPTQEQQDERRTREFYSKHLSPELLEEHQSLVKNLTKSPSRSDEDVIAEALELGVDIEEARIRGAFPDYSADIVALKDLMSDKARKVSELSRDFRNGIKGSAADEAALLNAIGDFAQIRGIFDETRSNLGRTFRALQLKIANLDEDFSGLDDVISTITIDGDMPLTSESIREMARRIAESNNPAIEIGKQTDRFDKDALKFIHSMYYNGLLGTANTVFWTGPIGNATNFTRELFSDTFAGLIGAARGKLGAQDERMLMSEVINRWQGIAVAFEGLKPFKDAWAEFTAPVGQARRNRWQSQQIEHLPTSMLLEWGTRGLQAGDAFFRQIIETSNMYGLATRQAAKEVHLQHPDEPFGSYQDEIKTRTAQIMAAPSKKLLAEVQAAADRTLLQEQLTGNFLRGISKISKTPVIGPMVLPIVTTVANNLRRGVAELTGVPSAIRLGRRKVSGAEMDREISKLLIGAFVTSVVGYMAWNGQITGLGPTNPNERKEWLLTHRPMTITVGGQEFSYQGLDPFASHMAIIADTLAAYKSGDRKLTKRGEDSLGNLGWNTTEAFLNATTNSSFLSGIRTAAASDENMWENLVLGMAAPAARIPFASEYVEKSDEFARDTGGSGFGERIVNRIQQRDPEIYTAGREALPIRVDSLGQPVDRKREQITDPTYIELGRLFDNTGVNIVGGYQATRHGVPIPRDLYNAMNLITGPVIKQRMESFMARPEYKRMPDERKARELQRIASETREAFGKQLDIEMARRDPGYTSKMRSALKQARALPLLPEESP